MPFAAMMLPPRAPTMRDMHADSRLRTAARRFYVDSAQLILV